MKKLGLLLLVITFLFTSCLQGEDDRIKFQGIVNRSKAVIPDPSANIQGQTAVGLYTTTRGEAWTAVGQLFKTPLNHEYLTKVGFYLRQFTPLREEKTNLNLVLKISKWDGKKPDNNMLWLSSPVIIEKDFEHGWVYFDIAHLKLDSRNTYVAWLSLANQKNPVNSSIGIVQMLPYTSTPPPKNGDLTNWQPKKWTIYYTQGKMVMCVNPDLMQSMEPLTAWRQESIGVNTGFTMWFENMPSEEKNNASLNKNRTLSIQPVDSEALSVSRLKKDSEKLLELEIAQTVSLDKRIEMLFDAPQHESQLIQKTSIPYTEETRNSPSVPIALTVATTGTVVAVTFKNGFTEIYDLISGQILSRIQTSSDEKLQRSSSIYDFFLSPNGRIFIVSSQAPKRWVKLWDTHTGDLLREEVIPLFPRAFTSKGRYFIFTGDRKIGVFDFATGDVLGSIEGKDSASFLGLSPDDKWLIFLRDKKIECWELSNIDGKKFSFTLRSSEIVDNYKKKPTSISFAQDNNSFYCTLRDNPVIDQWRLPDLKFLRRMRFPKFNIMKIQGPHDNFYILEGISADKIPEGFSADMVKETAQRLIEHTGDNCKIASLRNSQFLVATPFDLKITKLPNPTTYSPFSQIFGEIIAESIILPLDSSDSSRVNYSSKVNCENYQLEAIGVYEGKQPNNKNRGFQDHTPGHVSVKIGATRKPIKLLLCSYEPVIWQLQASSDAIISEVLLSGSNESRIEGLSIARVTFIGNSFAYNIDSTSNLTRMLKKHTGCDIIRFQGSYIGDYFSIGDIVFDKSQEKPSNDKQDLSNSPSNDKFYKRIGEHGKVIYYN